MSTKKKPSTVPADSSVRAPVILFPLHGCEDVQDMTEAERVRLLRERRVLLRKHWQHEAVKAIIGLLEITTARLTSDAIAPGATAHDSGRASGANEQLMMLRMALLGKEQD